MKGLALCEQYYRYVGLPELGRTFPDLMPRAAVGLAGDGSDCLGFDDDISADHDFGPGFCLWLTDEDYELHGDALRSWYASLPETFRGYRRLASHQGGDRVGVMRTSDFYRRFTGSSDVPIDESRWLMLPEHYLAKATSGKVFVDSLGEFTRIREGLLAFYPEQVVWKKMAARMVTMAQSGQYNYPRSLKRGDSAAAFFAAREFVQATLSMAHLLEKKYMPYYKWAWRSFCTLDILAEHRENLMCLMTSPCDSQNTERIEAVCRDVRKILNDRRLVETGDDFLEAAGWELYGRITSEELRKYHILEG